MTAPDTLPTGERLQHFLARFFALEQHHADARFLARLDQLQGFQINRLRHTHAHLLNTPAIAPAVEYLLDEVYRGRDLKPVATDIHRAVNKAMRLLPHTLMATSATVLEAATLTQELDEAMTHLLADAADHPLTQDTYLAAYRQLGLADLRQRQFELIGGLGHQIDRYVRSRAIQTTFRLVRRPAHAAGFDQLYAFLDKAFTAMKPIPDTGHLLAQIANNEQVIMTRIFAGHPDPFN